MNGFQSLPRPEGFRDLFGGLSCDEVLFMVDSSERTGRFGIMSETSSDEVGFVTLNWFQGLSCDEVLFMLDSRNKPA